MIYVLCINWGLIALFLISFDAAFLKYYNYLEHHILFGAPSSKFVSVFGQNRSQILRLLTSINTSEDGEAEVCGVRLQVPVPRSPIRGCSEDHLPPLQQGPLLILLRF